MIANVTRSSISVPHTQAKIAPTLRGQHAAVVVYSTYPADTRVQRATSALLEAGMNVDVFCISGGEDVPRHESIEGANVTRIAITHRRESKLWYFLNYAHFLLAACWFLTRKSFGKKYAVVHVHNMPDILVFSAIVPKLRGARVILDLHDPMPELMLSIYGLSANQWPVRLLRALEKWSIGFADMAITPNIAFKDLFVARSCRTEKMRIVMNSPEESVFAFDPRPTTSARRVDAEFRIMHHGSIVHRHGIDLLVSAVAKLRPSVPGIRLDIYGHPTEFLKTVLAHAEELGVGDIVQYHGEKRPHQIADAIRHCDLGVVPNRESAFTNLNFPTRIFEYLALGRPVIAPSTKGIRDYFDDGELLMFSPGDVENLSQQILRVAQSPREVQQIVDRGREVYRGFVWQQEKSRFLQSVAALVRGEQCAA
jgi:glycosyltransferase involved in cell wall biosynthesis